MGSKESKSTTENKPPEWAAPLFKQSADEASKLYNSGAGGNTYLGNTVAPMGQGTTSGINNMLSAGNAWNTSSGTRNQFQNIGNQSMTDPYANKLGSLADSVKPQNVGTGGFSGIASGADGIKTEADYRKVLGQAQGPTAASQYLTDTASGKYLDGEGNPFYRQRLEREISDANAKIQSQFSGSGRYGSGANQGTIADNTSNMLMSGLENDYNREKALQMQAVGMLDSSKSQSLADQLAAVTGISGVQGQNIGNRLNALGQTAGIQAGNADRQLSGQSLQGNLLSNAGSLRGQGLDRALSATGAMAGQDQQNFENRLQGAQSQIGAGQLLDQQKQNELADEVARFYALDNQDWTRLGMLQSAAAGSAGNYGTQVATSRQPVGVGGIMSGMGSLLGKSDARVKENYFPVGYLKGHILWEFSYRGSADRFRGVMAQMVMDTDPEAVIMEPDGFYAVDYARLGFPMERIA